MSTPNNIRISKFLSYVLRHNPTVVDVHLDPAGWAPIKDLVHRASKLIKSKLTESDIVNVVNNDDKGRFEISPDGQLIRCTQGHSIPVNPDLEEVEPPAELYHGTAIRFLEAIASEGIQKMTRTHVHLSSSVKQAFSLGVRHGVPAVIVLDVKRMVEDGVKFYKTRNDLYLVDEVAPQYIHRTLTEM